MYNICMNKMEGLHLPLVLLLVFSLLAFMSVSFVNRLDVADVDELHDADIASKLVIVDGGKVSL